MASPPPYTSSQKENGDKAEPLNVLVFGPTGAGKSTIINLLTDNSANLAIGEGLKSCTERISRAALPRIHKGRKFTFFDTPGFDDTKMAPAQQLLKLAHGLDELNTEHSGKPHIHGVLYVHRITDNRMKGSAVGDIRVFEELIGKDMFEHVVIVTNMWENPPDEAHKRYEDELAKEQDFFGKIVNSGASAGDRYRIMKGSTAGQAQSALLDAFVKRPSKITQIQTEMQKDGAILGNTSAGRAVRNKISSVRKDLEEQLKNLRQYSSELTGEDPIRRNRMNQLIRNLESKLDELSEDEKLLDSNMALIKRWMIWTFAGTAAAISGECAAVAAVAAMAQAGVVGTEVLFAVGVAGVTVSGLGTLAVAGATVATGATLAYRGIKSFSKWIRDA